MVEDDDDYTSSKISFVLDPFKMELKLDIPIHDGELGSWKTS